MGRSALRLSSSSALSELSNASFRFSLSDTLFGRVSKLSDAAQPTVANNRASYALPAVAALITLKVAILFALAWNRRFVMDEFVQLGWAKYLANGLYETHSHPKALGYAIFFDLAHLLGWDARSMMLIGRME